MIGWALRLVIIWGGIGLAIYLVVISRIDDLIKPTPPAPVIAAPVIPAPSSLAGNSLVFRADRNGHVILDGYANGAPMRFIVDTGATLVALTVGDATAAGIAHSDLMFNQQVSTANGVVKVAAVTLREVRIGQFSTADVPAVVVENLSISLLGQSFLKRLDGYEMRDGMLTMNWN